MQVDGKSKRFICYQIETLTFLGEGEIAIRFQPKWTCTKSCVDLRYLCVVVSKVSIASEPTDHSHPTGKGKQPHMCDSHLCILLVLQRILERKSCQFNI